MNRYFHFYDNFITDSKKIRKKWQLLINETNFVYLIFFQKILRFSTNQEMQHISTYDSKKKRKNSSKRVNDPVVYTHGKPNVETVLHKVEKSNRTRVFMYLAFVANACPDVKNQRTFITGRVINNLSRSGPFLFMLSRSKINSFLTISIILRFPKPTLFMVRITQLRNIFHSVPSFIEMPIDSIKKW